MVTTEVTTTNFISETVLFVRDLIAKEVTDPENLSRGLNERFVLTGYPERAVRYPVITVQKNNINPNRKLGMQSDFHYVEIDIEVRVWARNMKEKDTLTQQVINALRSTEFSTDGSVDANLVDLIIKSGVDVNEPSKEGVKSTIIGISYKFVLGQ